MADLFDRIVAGGYYQPFGNLTPEQERCRRFTQQHLDDLLVQRQRDKFLHEVKVCCCGYGEADEEEPIEDGNFSQYQFYQPYTESLIFYEDRFDFLIKCVFHAVCKIASGFEDRYEHALLNALTFREVTTPAFPVHVLELRQPTTPRTVAEQHRSPEEQQRHFDAFVRRENSFAGRARAELARLEAEQRAAERARSNVMVWAGDDPAVAQAPQHADAAVGTADGPTAEEAEGAEGASVGAEEAAAATPPSATPQKTPAPLLGDGDATPMLNLLLQLQLQHDADQAGGGPAGNGTDELPPQHPIEAR